MPAERVPALISAVRLQGDFDVDEPTALGWLSDAHRLMVARSKCYRKRISLGNTSGAGSYASAELDQVIEVIEVLVGGVPYGRGRHSDIAAGAQHWLLLSGPGGIVVEDESSGGAYEISLVPIPATGAPIEVYAVCRAGALLATDDTTLKTPQEYDPALIAGAYAYGLSRDEGRQDLSASYRAEYEGACTELRQSVARRNAPRRARVSGYTI